MTEDDATAPDSPKGTDHAHRLLLEVWLDDEGAVSSAAFKTKSLEHQKYLGPLSVFVEERMEDGQNPDGLYFGKYERRVRFPISALIGAEYKPDGKTMTNCGFRVEMSPDDALAPHELFQSSHASVIGPTWKHGALKALARAVTDQGQVFVDGS